MFLLHPTKKETDYGVSLTTYPSSSHALEIKPEPKLTEPLAGSRLDFFEAGLYGLKTTQKAGPQQPGK